MRRREPAICLWVGDYSETSQVAHFLMRGGGKVHLLAKGSKRAKSRTGGPIDLLAEGELVYIPASREGLGTLV
jgi:recombinational DNA repair protein (RecF pathway)